MNDEQRREITEIPTTLRAKLYVWIFERQIRHATRLPYFAVAYLDHLIAEHNKTGEDLGSADEIIARLKKNHERLTWGDLYALERILASAWTAEQINSGIGALKFRLKQVAGDSTFEAYEKSRPQAADSLEARRAELLGLLQLLHWYYFLLPIRNRLRINKVNFSIWMLVFWSIMQAAWIFFCWRIKFPPMAMVFGWVFYLGIVGGYISALRRLQNLDMAGDPLIAIYNIEASASALWLSPLLGAAFAMILSLLFIGGLVSGSVFPRFQEVTWKIVTLRDWLCAVQPNGYKDYAVLLVWSFIAGFAERLVPDSLDKLIAEQNAKKTVGGKS